MSERREEGAGTVLAVGVVAGVLAVAGLLLPIAATLTALHSAAAAADASALAAADTALGLATGVPCDRAREVAAASGAVLEACRQGGDLVRVRVAVRLAGLPVAADAVAGPPPGNPP